MDRRDEAERALRGALDVAERIAYPRGVWRGLAALAEIAARRGAAPRAEALRTRAREGVERLAVSLRDTDLRRTLRTTSGLLD